MNENVRIERDYIFIKLIYDGSPPIGSISEKTLQDCLTESRNTGTCTAFYAEMEAKWNKISSGNMKAIVQVNDFSKPIVKMAYSLRTAQSPHRAFIGDDSFIRPYVVVFYDTEIVVGSGTPYGWINADDILEADSLSDLAEKLDEILERHQG